LDKLTKDQRRKNMKAVKNKDTQIELTLRKALWSKGLRYRKNCLDVYGKPDIVFKKEKIAIFCDSEFWHGYNWGEKKYEIKSNREFWWKKIERNIERDKQVNIYLKNNKWTVIRFWGKEIFYETNKCVEFIEFQLNEKRKK